MSGLMRSMMARRRAVQVGGDRDPHYASVLSLLHFNGPAASSVMADQKGKVWTARGNAQLDTAQTKWGSASLLLDGKRDYIDTPYVEGHFSPVNDHTVECWVRPTVAKRHTPYCILSEVTGASGHYCAILGNGMVQVVYGSSASWQVILTTATVLLNVWTHLAITKQGNVVRVFIGGVLAATHTLTGNVAPSVGSVPSIGRDRSAENRYFQGWIDDFRYTDGVCRYTESFVPPSEPFPSS